jgi:hypothetical protein
MHYAGFNRHEAARVMGWKSPRTNDRATRRGGEGRETSYEEMVKFAHACGLPFEFFVADFRRLREITPPALRARFSPADDQTGEELARLLDEDDPPSEQRGDGTGGDGPGRHGADR